MGQPIMTTHAGALPRPEALIGVADVSQGDALHDSDVLRDRLRPAVADVVRRQVDLGLSIVNDGEYGKAMRAQTDYGAWLSYLLQRLTGWEPKSDTSTVPAPASGRVLPRGFSQRRDRQAFPDVYAEIDRHLFGGGSRPASRAVTGPITYKGEKALQVDIENLKAALANTGATCAFMTAVAPGSFGREQNRYYKTQEEFLFAIAEAMRVEYGAIIDAGFVLQIDDPGMAENWDAMDSSVTIEQYREYARVCIAALNQGLAGLPADRIRYHMCWGSWHGPHLTDIPLGEIVDLLLTVRAGALSIEAGNVRHEHEWKVWREVRLPDHMTLIPGVVSHATNVVEHPELVADRLVRFANLVGRERVIGGTDCGLGGRVHPSLAWAKLRSLVEGAELASRRLTA
jgi:5-methyltetrahydropteroyltriglutamate--homocysteine methyltransferase